MTIATHEHDADTKNYKFWTVRSTTMRLCWLAFLANVVVGHYLWPDAAPHKNLLLIAHWFIWGMLVFLTFVAILISILISKVDEATPSFRTFKSSVQMKHSWWLKAWNWGIEYPMLGAIGILAGDFSLFVPLVALEVVGKIILNMTAKCYEKYLKTQEDSDSNNDGVPDEIEEMKKNPITKMKEEAEKKAQEEEALKEEITDSLLKSLGGGDE